MSGKECLNIYNIETLNLHEKKLSVGKLFSKINKNKTSLGKDALQILKQTKFKIKLLL